MTASTDLAHHVVAGQARPSASGDTLIVVDPATGRQIGTVATAGPVLGADGIAGACRGRARTGAVCALNGLLAVRRGPGSQDRPE